MEHNKAIIVFLSVIIQIAITSCSNSEYDKLINEESKKSTVNDSLIFNLRFGDSKKDFFSRCWELNKQGLVFQGPNNNYARYVIKAKNEGKSSINMNFYGIFDEKNKMTGIDMLFDYTGWSLWTGTYTADKLLLSVLDSLSKWYPGNDFILINLNKIDKNVHVKVDANRQIIAYAKDSKDVVVKIEDLRKKYPSKFVNNRK